MSTVNTNADGTPGPSSLIKAAEDVRNHGYIHAESLKEEQKMFRCLQVTLAEVEKEGREAEKALRWKARELHLLKGEMEQLEQQMLVLHERCMSITAENTKLQNQTREEEEKAGTARAMYSTYQKKMEDHRQAEVNRLEEERALGRAVTPRKEDLKDPHGRAVHSGKSKIDAEEVMGAMRRAIGERRELLRRECEGHSHIKTQIQIENRRFEAIVKRLHCQLHRAQAVHRQRAQEILIMERQKAELQQQLETSQQSA